MKSEKECHITSIGGQAVLEGVMMRGPKEIATAVRQSNGEIVIKKQSVSSLIKKYKIFALPIIRGVVSFAESMVVGVKTLMYSADMYDIEGDDTSYEPSKFEKYLERKFGDKIKDIAIYFAVFISLIMSIGLFMLLPTVIVGVADRFIANRVLLNLVEGAVRLIIFLTYLTLVSKMKDIQRVFQYHGAEHKSIAAYEHGEELTVENARKHSRLHPRCGTSFLLFVMVVSILVFSFLRWDGGGQSAIGKTLYRMGSRLLLLPIVAGISYEIIRVAGRSKNKIVALLTKPGLWLQRLTTREPDDSQLEVAIAALKSVITDDKGEDKW